MEFGDQIIDADGSFFKQVTIIKPDTLIAENIKKNVEIGGITGTFAGDEVEKTAQIDYSDYTPVYTEDEFLAFKKAENLGKIVRVMYEPGLFVEGQYLRYYKCVLANDGVTYSLEMLDNDEVPSKNEYVILADEDTVLTQVTIPKHENLIPANIKKDTDINGVSGSFIGNGYEYTESSLDFTNEPVELVPDTDKLFSKVIIQRPPNLISSNIKEGVSIAGVLGTYKLSGLPKLNKPTGISNLSNVGTTAYDAYLYVSNPSSNGNFVTECQLFSPSTETIDGVETTTYKLVAKKTVSGVTSSINFYATDWIVDYWPKTDTLRAVFLGNKFTSSDSYTASNLTITYGSDNTIGGICVTEMNYDVINASLSKAPVKIYWGQHLQTILTPKSGFYLPKNIEIEDSTGLNNWTSNDNLVYDSQTGVITLKYNRMNVSPSIMSAQYINIKAEAPNMPWLKDFTTLPNITNDILAIPLPDNNAERADIWLNGNVVHSVPREFPPKIWSIANRGNYRTTITSASGTGNSSGGKITHTFKNDGTGGSAYVVYRYTFTCEKETKIRINWTQYRYSTYNLGYISTLDCNTFAVNYGIENSSECLFYGPNYSNRSTVSGSIDVTIPVGTHWIDVKWRGYYNYTAYYFSVSIDYPTAPTLTVDLTEVPAFDAPGDYVFKVTGEAEGYTGTDPVSLSYTRTVATVDGETLVIDGTVEDETLSIDYAAVDDEVLFCGLAPASVEDETLSAKVTASEETATLKKCGS